MFFHLEAKLKIKHSSKTKFMISWIISIITCTLKSNLQPYITFSNNTTDFNTNLTLRIEMCVYFFFRFIIVDVLYNIVNTQVELTVFDKECRSLFLSISKLESIPDDLNKVGTELLK